VIHVRRSSAGSGLEAPGIALDPTPKRLPGAVTAEARRTADPKITKRYGLRPLPSFQAGSSTRPPDDRAIRVRQHTVNLGQRDAHRHCPRALTGVYKNMPRGIIALVFRCKITGGHLFTNDEVTAFHWADEGDINQLTSEAYAVRLLDAFRQRTTPSASMTEPSCSTETDKTG
jgi:hypothetical protein